MHAIDIKKVLAMNGFPKAWKKMNRKEREQWMVQRIEEWKAEVEAEKQALLAGAAEKRAQAQRDRNEQLARDVNEHDIRSDILDKTVSLFKQSEKQKIDQLNKKKMAEEWNQYVRCDGLPDPRVVTQMNTYLHLWQLKEVCDDNVLEVKCREVLPMLQLLEELVTMKKQFTPQQIKNYNDVRINLRIQLSATIEMASFYLLRNLEKHLKSESTRISTYERALPSLKLNLWVAIKWPTRKIMPNEPDPEPVELTFPSLNVTVILPKTVDTSGVCVRAARSLVDLLSENSRTFGVNAELENKCSDLMDFNENELQFVIKMKKEQEDIRRKFYKEIGIKIKELELFLKQNPYTKNEAEKETLDKLNMTEAPTMPDPREFAAMINEKIFTKYLKGCITRTRAGEVNLRKYRICGGVLNLDLIITPPQPKRMGYDVFISTLMLPKALQAKKFQVQYRAPAPPEPGVIRTPEEIEHENRKIALQYEKLAQVFIELPQDVMWVEPPVVCQWNEMRKLWTTNYVNDYKYNEDKLTVQFRTGVLWPIGIAALKYGNLPYQGWDVKPDRESKGVLVTVTGLFVTVTWLCVSNYVKLRFIANATTSAMKQHYNKPYTVAKMVQLMRDAGCDFFPELDGHNNIEGTCPKELAMEYHLYHAMAYLSRAYNFQWSRWNVSQGSRVIIIQFREAVDTKREAKLGLLYVTPQRCTILKRSELSMQEFDDTTMLGLPFFPDLFTLNLGYGSVDARRTTFNMKYRLVETVHDLLQALMLCSFS